MVEWSEKSGGRDKERERMLATMYRRRKEYVWKLYLLKNLSITKSYKQIGQINLKSNSRSFVIFILFCGI
jgi:hypothetical protein